MPPSRSGIAKVLRLESIPPDPHQSSMRYLPSGVHPTWEAQIRCRLPPCSGKATSLYGKSSSATGAPARKRSVVLEFPPAEGLVRGAGSVGIIAQFRLTRFS
jgi:hypothetical protein